MNKWQVIAPVIILFMVLGILSVIFSVKTARSDRRAIDYEIKRQLLEDDRELETLHEGERFPSLDAVRKDLIDPRISQKFFVTSLIEPTNVFFNSSQPALTGNALVLCVRFDNKVYGICANRNFKTVTQTEFQESHMAPIELSSIEKY